MHKNYLAAFILCCLPAAAQLANLAAEAGHAVETFGSEWAARNWLSSECGALNNRTPLEVIPAEGNEAEVERILDSIDYGMLA